MGAGFEHGYLPAGDARVIAATKVIGGGESVTITLEMSKLAPGGDYSFFCSYPGHSPMMHGRFQVNGVLPTWPPTAPPPQSSPLTDRQ